MAPATGGTPVALVSPDTASAVGNKANSFEVAPGPGTQPENVAGSQIDYFDIPRRRGSPRVDDREKEGDGQHSNCPTMLYRKA